MEESKEDTSETLSFANIAFRVLRCRSFFVMESDLVLRLVEEEDACLAVAAGALFANKAWNTLGEGGEADLTTDCFWTGEGGGCCNNLLFSTGTTVLCEAGKPFFSGVASFTDDTGATISSLSAG
jgi:hypothetical protein